MVRRLLVLVMAALLFVGCTTVSTNGPANEKKQADAALRLGASNLRSGQITLALRELVKADQLDPNNPEIILHIGLVYMAKKEYDRSIGYFKRALELAPDMTDAHNYLGLVYTELAQYETAEKEFQIALADDLYLAHHFVYNNLGLLYMQRQMYNQAEDAFKRAIENSPRFSTAYNNLGRIYLTRDELEYALENFEFAIQYSPKFAAAYYNKAITLERMGRLDEARKAYETVVELIPDTQLGREASMRVRELPPPMNNEQ